VKHLKVRVQDGKGKLIAKLRTTIPKPYRTKREPDSAAEVYATGHADGYLDGYADGAASKRG
jgi:hypothetical protein